jgi:hypothetical protein
MHTLGNANLQIEISTRDPQWIAGWGSESKDFGLCGVGRGSRTAIR